MDKNPQKLQLIYILPNLFTAGSAFVGVLSIFASFKGEFEKAAIFIILSLILDGLDGRIARMTNTSSKFGVEFDSLADLVAFGVAPAMLFYNTVGIYYGKLGSLAAALYVVFGAIRLARFNITSSQNEPSVFIGVPIPTAAVVISMWIMIYEKYPLFNKLEIFILFCQIALAFLMVSNIRYPSFKKIDFHKSNLIRIVIYLVFFLSLTYLYPMESLASLITLYLFYGLVRAIYTIIVAKLRKNKYNDDKTTKE